MNLALLYAVGGPILTVIGILIVVFRKRYAAWQNRAQPVANPAKTWGPKSAALVGVVCSLAGLYLTIFLGLVRLH